MKPWMATPRKHRARREIAEATLWLLTLFAVVVAMSVDFPA